MDIAVCPDDARPVFVGICGIVCEVPWIWREMVSAGENCQRRTAFEGGVLYGSDGWGSVHLPSCPCLKCAAWNSFDALTRRYRISQGLPV